MRLVEEARAVIDPNVKRLVDRAVELHGHLCPALMTGVPASRIAMRELGGRAEERQRQAQRCRAMSALEAPEDEVFTVREVQVPVPREASIRQCVIPEQCGEPVMERRRRCLAGKPYCIPCFGQLDRR